MASMTMAACFIGGAAASPRRAVISCSSAKSKSVMVVRSEKKGDDGESSNGRREVVFAAISATICSVAGLALADGPKRGSPEAKKAYGPVCVANPTARICHN